MATDKVNPLDAPRVAIYDPTQDPRTAVTNASPFPVTFTAHITGDSRQYTYEFEPWETQDIATEWLQKPMVRKGVFGFSIVEKLCPQLIRATDPKVKISQALEKDWREITSAELQQDRLQKKSSKKE